MGADFFGDSALDCQFTHDLPEPVTGHGFAPVGDKEVGTGTILEQGRAASIQVFLNFPASSLVKGDHSFLVALTQYPDMTAADATTVQGQVDQLRYPHSSGIEEVEHGIVALDERCFLRRDGQQLFHLCHAEDIRQAGTEFWGIYITGRVFCEQSLLDEEFKETAQSR